MKKSGLKLKIVSTKPAPLPVFRAAKKTVRRHGNIEITTTFYKPVKARLTLAEGSKS